MERILFFFITAMSLCSSIVMAMNHNYNISIYTNHDAETGRLMVTRIRQGAAFGAIAGGWGFFTATAVRHAQWPYWVKRFPLGLFLISNTINAIPTLMAIENDQKRMASFGQWFNGGKKQA